MSRLLLRPKSYMHVVFPDPAASRRAAANFTAAVSNDAHVIVAPDESLTSDEYDCVRWLFGRAGLNADGYRRDSIKRRIPACLRSLRVDSLAHARTAIQRNADLLQVAMNALVIGVTGFFRDSAVFDAVRDRVIPEILGGRDGPRIWSAGCSDGSELYSIAMLLAERGGLQRSTMLGTDCRVDALARAAEGRYDAASIRHIPSRYLNEYFRDDGSKWQVQPDIRSNIQWRAGNVLASAEPGGWDLILCRNMAIYLHAATAWKLWNRLSNCLHPGGFLVLGKAERPQGGTGLSLVAPCIYRRDRS